MDDDLAHAALGDEACVGKFILDGVEPVGAAAALHQDGAFVGCQSVLGHDVAPECPARAAEPGWCPAGGHESMVALLVWRYGKSLGWWCRRCGPGVSQPRPAP